jgi:hypothetical protein
MTATTYCQVGGFLIPPEDFVQRHADRLGDDALLVLIAGLSVGSETGARLLAATLQEAERATRAATLQAWDAASTANEEARAAA